MKTFACNKNKPLKFGMKCGVAIFNTLNMVYLLHFDLESWRQHFGQWGTLQFQYALFQLPHAEESSDGEKKNTKVTHKLTDFQIRNSEYEQLQNISDGRFKLELILLRPGLKAGNIFFQKELTD